MADPNLIKAAPYLLPPMRGEKRVFPIPVNITELPFDGVDGGDGSGYESILSSKVIQSYNRVTGKKTISDVDFDQSRVTRVANLTAGLTDFIYVRLKHRGLGKGDDAIFKFLVNPENIQVSRQVVDAEALTRAGLQTGIWGDLIDINLAGVTAGQYFAGVLVDEYSDYSASNRNLMELVSVYENNGVWFEGETGVNPAAMPASAARKQIQMQADVTLVFGNFIWSGCFTDLSVEDTVDTPYYNKFNLGFMAWRERFKSTSPWQNSIAANPTDEYFGHAYELYQKRAKKPEPPSLTANSLEASKSAPGSGFNFNPGALFGDTVTGSSLGKVNLGPLPTGGFSFGGGK
jgi:hypothetical protein